MTNKARLQTGPNGITVWQRDVVEQFCPYQHSEIRCGSWCPLFRVDTDRTIKRQFVYISCCGDAAMYEIEEDDDGQAR